MIIVDTTVWSETMRSDPEPRVLTWMNTHAEHLTLVPTVANELMYGVERLPPGRRRTALRARLDALIAAMAPSLASYDVESAVAHARLRLECEQQGRALSAEDGQIAGTAASRGLPVATRNIRDFEGLGIDVIDPWSATP